jgi:predicted lysophospholipase L1 biosynthesis ABC-type transport system permease subunit
MNAQSERQYTLPLNKAIRIAWRNIRVRWWRSMLVTMGIILALAFLMYVFYSDAMRVNAFENGSRELLESLRKEGITQARDEDADVQTNWMVGLALLISFVGILNAMVLNVTERFREIGTMKCLGALDSLIIKLYLIESMFQGLGGTLIGITLGIFLALGEGLSLYGLETFTVVPGLELLRILLICVVAGVLLSVGGALYPAWLAAKMEPVDAMSSEV